PNLEKSFTSKGQVLAELDKSWAHCKAQLNAVDPATMTGDVKYCSMPADRAVLGMAGDLHEHLGQLIAYARSVGVKPPWSKYPLLPRDSPCRQIPRRMTGPPDQQTSIEELKGRLQAALTDA